MATGLFLGRGPCLWPDWKLCETRAEEFFVPEICALNTHGTNSILGTPHVHFCTPHISCAQIFKCVRKIFRAHDKVSRLGLLYTN